jgi:EAL domain-containing protein (putative c-di-GMP-specific phosphodiesterase class I)
VQRTRRPAAARQAVRCELGQGYRFSGPLPPDELTPLLAAGALAIA